MTPDRKKAGKKEESFEEAVKGLEGIVQSLEDGELPLEEALSLFEEGIRLTRVCSQRLDHAEKRIEILTRDDKGEPLLETGDPDTYLQKKGHAEGEGEIG